jgi:hypothetical protein
MLNSGWLEDEVKILLDFIGDLYRHPSECLRNGNIIDYNVGIMLPWSKRSDIDRDTKERMKQLVDNISPPLFYQKNKVEWCLNIENYSMLEDAVTAIEGVWEPAY